MQETVYQAMFSGVFAVYKPKNITSSEVITKLSAVLNDTSMGHNTKMSMWKGPGKNKYKNVKNVGVKVGHGGTLDKHAEGVLIVGVGSGTKLLGMFLSHCTKGYIAEGLLGMETTTLDQDGVVYKTDTLQAYKEITEGSLKLFLDSKLGESLQVPPMYSALKVNGKRLSDLARALPASELISLLDSSEVALEAKNKERVIRIDSVNLLEFSLPRFTLSVTSGSGFYVRSFIRDIGQHFNSCAYMTSLIRSSQHCFDVNDDYTLREHDWTKEKIIEALSHGNKLIELNKID